MNTVAGISTLPVVNAKKRKISLLFISAVVYLFFLAFERIDLLQGQGTFNLSLELIGCIAFLVCYILNIIGHKGRFRLSLQLKDYAKLLVVFVAVVLLSVFFSSDIEQSARRIVLLSIYVFAGLFSVNYLFTRRAEDMTFMLVNAMVFLSIVYAICSLYDVLMWFNPDLAARIGDVIPFYKNDVRSIGSDFLRVRGASGDPNRAGIFMIINSYIVMRYCKRPVLKVVVCVLNVIVLALTLSRTAVLCLVLFIVLQAFAANKMRKKSVLHVVLVFLLIVMVITALYQVPLIQEAVGRTLDRLNTRDGSADEHIRIFQEGMKAAFSSLKILLVGNGYGISANILGGGKYANFHNAFVSFLVESGVLSLIFFVCLLLYPMQKDKSQFPIIAVLILANIPYQIYVEPYFWFLLPFLCIAPQFKHKTLPEGDKHYG